MNVQKWLRNNPGKTLNDFYAWKLKNNTVNDDEEIDKDEHLMNEIQNQQNKKEFHNSEKKVENPSVNLILKYQKPLMLIVLFSTFLPFWDDQNVQFNDLVNSFQVDNLPSNNFWGKVKDIFDKFKYFRNFSFIGKILFLSPLFVLLSMFFCFTKIFNISTLHEDFPYLSSFLFWFGILPIMYSFFFNSIYFKIFFISAGGPGFYLIYFGVGILSNSKLFEK
jgi:hypothetical protein